MIKENKTIEMCPEWVEAIGKAAAVLRFNACNSDLTAEPARSELLSIAEKLTQINNAVYGGHSKTQVVSTLHGNVAEETFYDANDNITGHYVYHNLEVAM